MMYLIKRGPSEGLLCDGDNLENKSDMGRNIS